MGYIDPFSIDLWPLWVNSVASVISAKIRVLYKAFLEHCESELHLPETGVDTSLNQLLCISDCYSTSCTHVLWVLVSLWEHWLLTALCCNALAFIIQSPLSTSCRFCWESLICQSCCPNLTEVNPNNSHIMALCRPGYWSHIVCFQSISTKCTSFISI